MEDSTTTIQANTLVEAVIQQYIVVVQDAEDAEDVENSDEVVHCSSTRYKARTGRRRDR